MGCTFAPAKSYVFGTCSVQRSLPTLPASANAAFSNSSSLCCPYREVAIAPVHRLLASKQVLSQPTRQAPAHDWHATWRNRSIKFIGSSLTQGPAWQGFLDHRASALPHRAQMEDPQMHIDVQASCEPIDFFLFFLPMRPTGWAEAPDNRCNGRSNRGPQHPEGLPTH